MPRPFQQAYFIILSLIWWPNLVAKATEHSTEWVNAPIWIMPAKAFSAFGAELAAIGIAAAVATLILVQGASYPMAIYQSLVNRFVTPVIERHEARGRAQGHAEGRVQGHTEGAQVQNDLWNTWLQRKEAAEAQGIEFNEPRPGTTENTGS